MVQARILGVGVDHVALYVEGAPFRLQLPFGGHCWLGERFAQLERYVMRSREEFARLRANGEPVTLDLVEQVKLEPVCQFRLFDAEGNVEKTIEVGLDDLLEITLHSELNPT